MAGRDKTLIQEEHVLPRDHEVLWLDVAVDQLLLMKLAQHREHLHQKLKSQQEAVISGITLEFIELHGSKNDVSIRQRQ